MKRTGLCQSRLLSIKDQFTALKQSFRYRYQYDFNDQQHNRQTDGNLDRLNRLQDVPRSFKPRTRNKLEQHERQE